MKSFLISFVLAISLAGLVAAQEREEKPVQVPSMTLGDCIAFALRSSHVLEGARAGEKEKRWLVEASQAPTRPRLHLQGSSSYLTPVQRFHLNGNSLALSEEWNYSATLSLEQTLSDFGRSDWSLKAARSGVDAAAWESDETQRAIALEACRHFLACLRVQAQIRVALDDLQARKELLRVSQLRVEQGTAAEYDLIRSRAAQSEAEASLLRLELEYEQALKTLWSLTSVKASPSELSFSPLVPEHMEEGLAKALARPDIRRLESLVEQAANLTESERSQDSPRLSFFSEYTQQNPAGFQLGQRWHSGLRLEIPLFDGGLTKARVGQSQAREEQVKAQLLERRRRVELEVENSYLAFQRAFEELEPARQSLAEAEESYRLSKLRYEVGLSTLLELLDDRSQLTRAQSRLSTTEMNFQLAWIEWLSVTYQLQNKIPILNEKEEQK